MAVESIVITGASSGIGEALAKLYAAPGIRLGLTGRDSARLEAVAEACRKAGAEVVAETLAVTDRDAMADFITRMTPLRIVIANAGVSGNFKQWDEFDAHVRGILDVNITGVLNTVHPAIPPMIAAGRGQIAVVASIASFISMPGAVAYSSSKAFARSYAEGLRGQLAPRGIRVSSICPGFITTRMTARNRFPMPFLMDADHAARIIRRGLEKNQGRIAFPFPMIALAHMLTALPFALYDWIMRRAPAKD